MVGTCFKLPTKFAHYAVLERFIAIGEAANALSEEFKTKYCAMPWNDLRKIRNSNEHLFKFLDMGLFLTYARRDVPLLRQWLDDIREDNSAAKKFSDNNLMKEYLEDIRKKEIFSKKSEPNFFTKIYQDYFDIENLEIITRELTNIDTFMGNHKLIQDDITGYAVRMSLIMISVCAKTISSNLKEKFPLHIQYVVNNNPFYINWKTVEEFKKLYVHYYEKINQKVLAKTAINILNIDPKIREILQSIYIQMRECLGESYFKTKLRKELFKMERSHARSIKILQPIGGKKLGSIIFTDAKAFFAALMDERQRRLKNINFPQVSPKILMAIVCIKPYHWITFIIKPDKADNTKVTVRYICSSLSPYAVNDSPHSGLPYVYYINILAAYYRANIQFIAVKQIGKRVLWDNLLIQNIKAITDNLDPMDNNKNTVEYIISKTQFLAVEDTPLDPNDAHFFGAYEGQLCTLVLSEVSKNSGFIMLTPQDKLFFTNPQSFNIALRDYLDVKENKVIIASLFLSPLYWAILIIKPNEENIKVWQIDAKVGNVSPDLQDFFQAIRKCYAPTEVTFKVTPLIQLGEAAKLGEVIVENIKGIIDGSLDLNTGPQQIEQIENVNSWDKSPSSSKQSDTVLFSSTSEEKKLKRKNKLSTMKEEKKEQEESMEEEQEESEEELVKRHKKPDDPGASSSSIFGHTPQ